MRARLPYVTRAIEKLTEGSEKNKIKSHFVDAALLTTLQGKRSLEQQIEINKLKERIKKDKEYIAKLVAIMEESDD